MTAASELADEMEALMGEATTIGRMASIGECIIANRERILSALRRVDVMTGALEDIAADGIGAKWYRAKGLMAAPEVIARQALTGEA